MRCRTTLGEKTCLFAILYRRVCKIEWNLRLQSTPPSILGPNNLLVNLVSESTILYSSR